MLKTLILSFVLLLTLGGCSKNSIFPTDTKVYGSPQEHDYRYEEHFFSSSQGALLHGWMFRSKGPSRGLIVVTNGMRYNMSERFKKWTWVLEEGYDLFIYDYRGYGGSVGEVDMFGFVDDVTAAITYSHQLAPTLPMVLVGQSMGGSFVIDAVAKSDYPYVRLLIIDSTMIGFAKAADALIKKHFLLWPLIWVPDAITPKGVDAIDFVDKTKTATLFVVGQSDSVIPPEHSLELYIKAEEPKALWIVENAEHVECLCAPEVRADLKKVLEEVLKEEYGLIEGIRYYRSQKSLR